MLGATSTAMLHGDEKEDNATNRLEASTRNRFKSSADKGTAQGTSRTDVPPNGGYGWVCVAACATING